MKQKPHHQVRELNDNLHICTLCPSSNPLTIPDISKSERGYRLVNYIGTKITETIVLLLYSDTLVQCLSA